MKKLILVLTIFLVWSCEKSQEPKTDTSSTVENTVTENTGSNTSSEENISDSETPYSPYTCNPYKLCTQIKTCAEAYYQLNVCGYKKRDGDNDGIPCENVCN